MQLYHSIFTIHMFLDIAFSVGSHVWRVGFSTHFTFVFVDFLMMVILTLCEVVPHCSFDLHKNQCIQSLFLFH